MKGRWLLLILLGFFWLPEGSARHIIGGDMTYECLGNGKYKITMYVYRDCRPQSDAAQLDDDASLAVYQGTGFGAKLVRAYHLNLRGRDFIEHPDYPCLILPANICVERGKYEFEITLPDWPSEESYYVVYQRCCRNNTISNLRNPGETGATFYVEISRESMKECNSSPTFDQFPPTVVCVDQEFTFDHSVTDVEGDSIVYRFGDPLEGGGMGGSSFTNPGNPNACDGVKPDPSCPPPFKTAGFRDPYSTDNPMGGDPVVTIDSKTGMITGTPRITGQFVIQVVAEEYRNGMKIGEISRDFQFNVAQCDPTVFAGIKSAVVLDENNVAIKSCGEFTIPFRDSSYDRRFIKTYEWQFEIEGKTEVYEQQDVDVTFPGWGDYRGKLIVNKGTECSDSANIQVSVYPGIEADFVYDYDTCVAGDVEFRDAGSFSEADGGITDYQWDFGDGNFSQTSNPDHLYETAGIWDVSLTVTDKNLCSATKSATLRYFPVPPDHAIREDISIVCLPAPVVFDILPPPIDPTYDIQWDFGDGNTGEGYLPEHIYTEEGDFDISVKVVSPIGCELEKRFPRMITTQPSPVAEFDYTPEHPTSLDKVVTFTNHSREAVSYQWDIDRLGTYGDKDLVIDFPDTGLYQVSLMAVHENGCRDTMIRPLDIEPIVIYSVPNAFTPNGDDINEEFRGIGIFAGMREFEMQVFDRWGNLIFYSRDPDEGWNGTVAGTGKKAPPGLYVYLVRYVDPRARPEQYQGEVLLIN